MYVDFHTGARGLNEVHANSGAKWCRCDGPVWRSGVWDGVYRRAQFESRHVCRACNLARLTSAQVRDGLDSEDGVIEGGGESWARRAAREKYAAHETAIKATNTWLFDMDYIGDDGVERHPFAVDDADAQHLVEISLFRQRQEAMEENDFVHASLAIALRAVRAELAARFIRSVTDENAMVPAAIAERADLFVGHTRHGIPAFSEVDRYDPETGAPLKIARAA